LNKNGQRFLRCGAAAVERGTIKNKDEPFPFCSSGGQLFERGQTILHPQAAGIFLISH
jgi:hypothetical protein